MVLIFPEDQSLDDLDFLFKTQTNNDEGIGQTQKKNKYLSVHGTKFIPKGSGSEQISDAKFLSYGTEVNDITFSSMICPLELPDGATILSATVHGADSGSDTWTLERVNHLSLTSELIASGNVETVDKSIAKGKQIVKNISFAYFFTVGAMQDHIESGIVEYEI